MLVSYSESVFKSLFNKVFICLPINNCTKLIRKPAQPAMQLVAVLSVSRSCIRYDTEQTIHPCNALAYTTHYEQGSVKVNFSCILLAFVMDYQSSVQASRDDVDTFECAIVD